MAEEKKKRKKLPKKLRVFLVVLVCIILIFPVYTVFKRISLYIECSEIKEYRTKEIVDNPKDYDIDLNKLILMINIYYYGMEPSYHLYIFEDGRVFTGVIQNVEQLYEHGKALERMDAGDMLNNVDMRYLGSISGSELYNILALRAKSDFSADHYDADDEYERKYYGIMEAPPKRIGAEVDPWINAENYVSGSPTIFFIQVDEGIRYYLYDKNANKMLHIIEDSWYFDQWMTDIYGDDWRSKVTIYRSEEDFTF